MKSFRLSKNRGSKTGLSLKPTETKIGPKKDSGSYRELKRKNRATGRAKIENRRHGQEANLLVPAFAFLKPEKTGTAGGMPPGAIVIKPDKAGKVTTIRNLFIIIII
ncbi:hypothetical protein P421_09650 [Heyndrickxia coagulans P38]|jgi:hypothetical protein|nr:hypothetical protein P421_09650 [Heyndrickxia coagulans P38]